tara:strand:- start:471 stop:1034 length:564 start_codon:yes stop_codon:yes gene_type:complete
MRIISGSFKGKKILQPKDIKTRPLKDMTKESIFNIITHSNKFKFFFNKSYILDLFSGVGSFGLECLSRGAKKVVFIENYKGVLPILKQNLISLKNISNYEIYENDIFKKNVLSKINYKYNLIFLDPPYKTQNVNYIFEQIKTHKVLDDNGIIILHRHKNEKDLVLEKVNILEEKIYGVSKIFFVTLN